MQNNYNYQQWGLTAAEVDAQKAQGHINTQPDSKAKSVSRIIRDNACTLFNFLNIILAALVIGVGSIKNALFVNVIIINTIIGIIQEIRAKRTVEKISLLNVSKVKVLRDGREGEIPLEEIVPGDLVLLASGNQIPADSVVIDGEMEVNESLLTGEADAIEKKAGDPLMSGSFVVAGRGKARVEKVGADNYATRLVNEVRFIRKPNSEIMQALHIITKFIGIVIIPVGIALLFQAVGVQGQTLQSGVTTTVAALVGMIPEGLVLLTSIALAVGVIRLSHYKTLVQELYCIETLARVDTLCLDKTGTITEGVMEMTNMELLGDAKDTSTALRAFVYRQVDDNPTFMAVKNSVKGKDPGWQAEQVVPFSSARKYSGITFKDQGTYILGAPEFVLKENYDLVRDRVEAQAQRGYRVLVFCRSSRPFGGKTDLPADLVPKALLVIGDKIRPEARETLEYFAHQGVTIKVISGDNPETVSEVAHRAGLKDYQRRVDASTLKDDAAVEAAAAGYTVFGRVTPHQKRVLVNALKKQGHTVAMTGDGVNDVLALRDADCSIAMANGSEATRQIAQLVLLDSNFANLTRVLSEGRRVINNITRTSALFLIKTFFSLLLALLIIISNDQYPFQPIQLTMIGAVTIGIPSFFLALEPNDAVVKGSFLQNVMRQTMPGAFTNVIFIIMVVWLGNVFGFSSVQISTMATLLCGTIGLVILYAVCQPMDKKRAFLFCMMVFLFLMAVLFFPGFFSILPLTSLSLPMIIVLLPSLFLTYPIMLMMRRFYWMLDDNFVKRHGLLEEIMEKEKLGT
jgi:cation-transporting ATPase E